MPKYSKYTQSQKKAYYSGMGYRAGKAGVIIPFRNNSNKQSFMEGYVAAKTTVTKYPKVKSPK